MASDWSRATILTSDWLSSCSCSRLSDRYSLASRYNKPACEMADTDQDPTTVLARSVSVSLPYQLQIYVANLILNSQSRPYFRYEFQIVGAVTSSLSQFCLQFGSYMLILYMLETLAGLNEATETQVCRTFILW